MAIYPAPPVTAGCQRHLLRLLDAKRFVLDDSASVPRIRAAQGHSIQIADPILDSVTEAASIPLAVHVTSRDRWAAFYFKPSILVSGLGRF
eukprot:1153615-Pelagomonas_calceolata.AAC.1